MLDFLKESGGEVGVSQLSQLYTSHPDVKSAVANAGWLRNSCEKYGGIEFVINAGSGVVRLEQAMKKASVSGVVA